MVPGYWPMSHRSELLPDAKAFTGLLILGEVIASSR
jgi:hypothetical protein